MMNDRGIYGIERVMLRRDMGLRKVLLSMHGRRRLRSLAYTISSSIRRGGWMDGWNQTNDCLPKWLITKTTFFFLANFSIVSLYIVTLLLLLGGNGGEC